MSLKVLLSWSQKEFSHLPWRKNRSLYRTLVSEIMLQQTTVGTVLNHYERFLKRFPDLESLAKASEEELTVAWKGLGYYRRARNLKKIAEEIFFHHKGEFPSDLETLMNIPGIGPYTANALIGIGMDERALAVDANLERVIARLFGIRTEKGLKLQKEIQKRFNDKKIFNQKISYRSLNEALMDLGRTYCQARRATCELCPLKKDCMAFTDGNPLEFPVMTEEKKKSIEHEIHLLRVFVLKKDKLLVYKKAKNEWLSGQYEVPTFVLSTTDKTLKQYPHLKTKLKSELSFKTGITKYKIQNHVVRMTEKEFKILPFNVKSEWRSILLEESNFSTTTLKALERLKK
ncbi:MAG: A/G-specific adenine glycosylase [Bacteriovoracia bacterium]